MPAIIRAASNRAHATSLAVGAPLRLAALVRRRARRVAGYLRTRRWIPTTACARATDEAADAEAIAFACNLCGHRNRVPPGALGRDTRSCARCGSTVRFRAIAWLLVRELLQREAALTEIAPHRGIRGLGLSDAAPYADALAGVFDYENTYYHRPPRLDISRVPDKRLGRYAFVVASDVFEHVAPPIEIAFANLRALLAPGGVLIFTAPFTMATQTVEHFPELHDWHIKGRNGRRRIYNTTRDGRKQVFGDLVFHGGRGTTLEMRVFSRDDLLRHLADAGFARARIADEACAAFGIVWPDPWSVPIVGYA